MIDKRQETETQAVTLKDFLSILFKHKAKIAVVFFAVVIAVTVVSFVMAPTYEARSTVLVKYGREYLYRPEVGGDKNQVISSGQSSDEILNSEIEIILNRDLMDKVVSVVGAEKLYPELIGNKSAKDAAIGLVSKNLKVEGVKKSSVLTVSFRHQDPDLAAQVVNLLVDKFREKHLQVYSDPKSSFIEEQLAEYRQKLKTSENALQTFKETQTVYSLDEQRNLLLKQRMELDTAYKETQNKIEELQEKLRSLTAQASALAEGANTFTAPEMGNMIISGKAKLLDLRLKEQELLIRYKEDSPPVKDVRKQIQMTSDFLNAQEKDTMSKFRTANPVYQGVQRERITAEADLRAQEAKLASVGPQIHRVDSALKTLDGQEKGFQELKRETEINVTNYQVYAQRYEEARISDDMNRKKMANISVIQAAVVPGAPIKPRKMLNIALSIVLGAVLALGVAFFSEYLGHTFNTARDVEQRLGLPVLTAVTGQ